MTITEAAIHIKKELERAYDNREAITIADWLLEKLTGAKKADRIINKEKKLTTEQTDTLNSWISRLLNQEPIQYVLKEAWFGGMKFYVDQNVLIPRPETEELADWVISDCKFPIQQLSLLDIGCGSGCISIFLKRKLRKADVWACDLSESALAVAERNAKNLGAEIHFFQMDILNEMERNRLQSFDIIVSNPPYIPENDKTQIAPNVLHFEPGTALFVPDTDSLLFYRAIADFGKKKLNPGGAIYVEINEDLGDAVLKLFQSKDYEAIIKKDMQGKNRMVKAIRNI